MAVLKLSEVLEAQIDGSLSDAGLKAMLRHLRRNHVDYPRRRKRNNGSQQVLSLTQTQRPFTQIDRDTADVEEVANTILSIQKDQDGDKDVNDGKKNLVKDQEQVTDENSQRFANLP